MMSTTLLTQFASDVAEGLGCSGQKKLSPSYLYDELGSALFEVITLLPEYGLSRADERLLRTYSPQIACATRPIYSVAELGSGSGRKTRYVLEALQMQHDVTYHPIDISAAALAGCGKELSDLAEIDPVCSDWMEGLRHLSRRREENEPMLLLFLGSSVGNIEPDALADFLSQVRMNLRPGDYFLLGADLVKDVSLMLAAYDDPTGVTAAFNLNLLGRMNRELEADFDIRSFAHEARWNAKHRRVEMHLLSRMNQRVSIRSLDSVFEFVAGETIWTESSHKFLEQELDRHAHSAGFKPVASWVDQIWPFAEVLWQVNSN